MPPKIPSVVRHSVVFDEIGRENLFEMMRGGIAPHLSRDKKVRTGLSRKYRDTRKTIESLLHSGASEQVPEGIRQILMDRDTAIKPHIAVIRAECATGALTDCHSLPLPAVLFTCA